jgi:ABC-type glycerol-3-phosphate transport system substrate-binding protein
MQFSNRQLFLIIAIVVGVGLTVFFVYSSLKTDEPGGFDNLQSQKRIRLVVWGIDDPKAFATIKKNFETTHKEVGITYVQLGENVIQDRLVSALALNQGPDVVMIKNRTLGRQKSFLSPAPAGKISLTGLGQRFPTVVGQDFVDAARKIYALPLSIDTLALVYNKDFFDQARIISPPGTWTELSEIVPQLVQKGSGGQIKRAAIALGGSNKSMTNAGDILPLLFMQNNLSLFRPEWSTNGLGRKVFDFYTQFSNPRSLAYTWNDIQPNDLQSFANLKSAMVLAYKRQIASITNQNAFLKYSIAPMPQLGTTRVDYADYWGLAVTRNSKQASLAWDFIVYATTVSQNAMSYSQATKQPPALLSLLQSSFDSPELGVFAEQAITARSWPSADDGQTRVIFSDMVSSYLTGQADADTALGRAQTLVSGLVTK